MYIHLFQLYKILIHFASVRLVIDEIYKVENSNRKKFIRPFTGNKSFF